MLDIATGSSSRYDMLKYVEEAAVGGRQGCATSANIEGERVTRRVRASEIGI